VYIYGNYHKIKTGITFLDHCGPQKGVPFIIAITLSTADQFS